MKLSADTPTKEKTVQGTLFSFPLAFVPEDFKTVVKRLEVSAEGLARQINQVLHENLANNLATRIKTAVKAKAEVPTQADLDEMVKDYDFTGARVSSGTSVSLTPRQRELTALVRKLVRNILKKSGYGDQPGPLTVAKKDAEPNASQISFDTFHTLVQAIVDGEDEWGQEVLPDGSPSPFYAKRQELIRQADENLASTEVDSLLAGQSMKQAAA